ncbi:unnamed protein product, partial [Effrenium voratum]
DWTSLVISQVMLATHYGIIYLLAVLGKISWQSEQLAYTFSDVGAKLFHSIFLLSLRRRRNLLLLQNMREAALLAAADLQRMISQANVPIFCVNRNLEIEDWNQKIEELTGVCRADAMNRRLPEFYAPSPANPSSWWQAAGELLQDALEGRDSNVVEMHFNAPPTQGGELKKCMVAVSATCQRTGRGDIKGAVCIGQDVTELTLEKQKAENLAESLNRLIESANAPIFEVDMEFRVTKWNSWLVNKTGLSQEELAGKHVSTVLSPDSKKKVQDAANRAITAAPQAPVELFEVGLLDAQQSRTAVLLLTATPCLAPTGRTTGSICIGQDITKLKDLEDRKASIMAMVSHELKSPLHGIIGLSNSLLEGSELPSALQKPMGMLHNCAKRLLDMVSNIMDASVLVQDKRMRMAKDPVQLQTIIEEVMLLSQQSCGERGSGNPASLGVKLINEVTKPLPVIEADAYRCTQLMYNLVANAVKFTHEGSVTVSASYDDEKQMVEVQVKDTGIGISPENIDRIFQPFDQEDCSESRRYSGLGLGLAISREVVHKHGGELTVSSVQGQGSTFRATLPYKMKSPAAEDKEHEEPPLQSPARLTTKLGEDKETPNVMGHSSTTTSSVRSFDWDKGEKKDKRRKERSQGRGYSLDVRAQDMALRITPESRRPVVLSVDDDNVHLQVINALLESTSYEVQAVTNGLEALQYLEEKPLPSLVLLDVMMADISGHEVLQSIREVYSPEVLPVIMVSAKSNKDSITSCLAMGANDYVQKPFGKSELLERIHLQLQMSTAARRGIRLERALALKDAETAVVESLQVPEDTTAREEAQPTALSQKLLEIATEEIKSLREDRKRLMDEAAALRQRVRELEEDAARRQKFELSSEQRQLVHQFHLRQKEMITQQDQLVQHINRLESYQKVQHQLVSAKVGTDVEYFGTPLPVGAAGGNLAQASPFNLNLRELQKAEHSLHVTLSRVMEISKALPGAEREELQRLVVALQK